MITPTEAELKFVDYLKQKDRIEKIRCVLRGGLRVNTAFLWDHSPEGYIYWANSFTGVGTENMTPDSIKKLLHYLELAGKDTSEFDHLKPEIEKFEPPKANQGVWKMSTLPVDTLPVNTLSAKQGTTYQGFCLLEQVLDPTSGELLYPAFTIVPLRVLYDLANNHMVLMTKCISIICPESDVSHYLKIQQECEEGKVVCWIESEEQPGIFHPVFAS